MSDYSQTTDFSAKDALSTGDPNKLIKGTQLDTELTAISTAIGSKYDSSDLASQAQAEAATLNTKLTTPLRTAQLFNERELRPVEWAYKASDELLSNSNTLQDDDDIAGMVLAAGGVYRVEGFLHVTQDNTNNVDFQFNVVLSQTPQAMTLLWQAAGDAEDTGVLTSGGADGFLNPASSSAQVFGIAFEGTIVAHASSAGTFKLQWAQNSAGTGSTTLESGSWMRLTKVA